MHSYISNTLASGSAIRTIFPGDRFSLRARTIAFALGFIALYVALDWAVFAYAAGPLAVTPWNPPPGVGLALLLAMGNTWAPVLFMAIFLAEILVRDAHLTLALALVLAAVQTAGYGVLAAMLRAGPLVIDPQLSRMGDLLRLTLSTAGITLLLAAVFVLLQTDLNAMRHLGVAIYVLRNWIGDFIGILVFAPLILLWWGGRFRGVQRDSTTLPHVFGIFLVALFSFWVVYGNVPAEQITSLYLLFIPLIWASLRFGLRGAVVTCFVLQLGVIMLSHLGAQSDATVLQFQIRLLVIAVTGLFLGVAVDALHGAEQKLRERQSELDRTLRLAASAELASAMAHELNQPLSAIGLYTRNCEMILKDRPLPELKETMDKIGAEVRRAGAVVHKLREFYRSGSSSIEVVEVFELVRYAVETLQERAARNRILMVQAVAAGLPPVFIDRVQVQTVLHNILANAIDAIRDAGGEIRQINIGARQAEHDMIMISVRDTGPGIDAADAEELFRPFTSSKSYGLGLGLSMSRSIISGHGGSLRVVPGPGGCCFEFTLPTVASASME